MSPWKHNGSNRACKWPWKIQHTCTKATEYSNHMHAHMHVCTHKHTHMQAHADPCLRSHMLQPCTVSSKWPLATHTITIVPDTPSSHLATTGHAHNHPRPNGGQLSAWPCALRLCIKATSDSRDRTEWRRERGMS